MVLEKETVTGRVFEIIPGALFWGTLAAVVLLSWRAPTAVAVFIILYDLYWLLKIVYLSLHLRSTFLKMKDNLKINWLDKLESEKSGRWERVYHLLILPAYREPYELVRETLRAISRVNYPKSRLTLILTIEERGGDEALKSAAKIKEEFGKEFFRFLVTVHPANLPGEIAGKGANESWAAKEAKRIIVDPLKIPYEDVLVSVFDADTQPAPEYFGRLTYVFLTCERPQRSSFQPVPLFVNNVYEAPAFSRVIAFFPTFWQMMQQARPEQLITFSSQAMPLKALIETGFWDTSVVSEDSLIFWQFYLRYDGDWRAEPIFYPVSMDAVSAPTFWETAKNVYRQQRRWAWGAENIPYMLKGFLKNKLIPLRKKIFWTFVILEGFYSWVTAPLLIFFLGWLPLVIGKEFGFTLLSYNLPQITGFLMTLATLGIATSAVLSAVLFPPRPAWFKKRHYFWYLLQWLLVPVSLNVFSTFPGIEAQTRLLLGGRFRLDFWTTPKTRKL